MNGSGVKLPGDEAKDKMYEPKQNKKVIRVLTVIAYVFSVSLAAIMLSLYYVFLWTPQKPPQAPQPASATECIGPLNKTTVKDTPNALQQNEDETPPVSSTTELPLPSSYLLNNCSFC